MAERNVFDGIRAALQKAQVDTDGELELTESSAMAGIQGGVEAIARDLRAGNESENSTPFWIRYGVLGGGQGLRSRSRSWRTGRRRSGHRHRG